MFKGTLYAYIILHIHAFSFICKETLQNKVKLCGGEIANVKVLKCAKYRTTPEMYEVFAHGSHCGINILEFILESILTIFLCIGIIVITKEWIQ